MQADEVQNAKEPIAAQIDLSGQTLSLSSSETFSTQAHVRPDWLSASCFRLGRGRCVSIDEMLNTARQDTDSADCMRSQSALIAPAERWKQSLCWDGPPGRAVEIPVRIPE